MELLVVDGYNVAHAWSGTKALLDAGAPLEEVRRRLVTRLAAHAAAGALRTVVVFDAPARRGTMSPTAPAAETVDGVEIRFGGGAFGSADHLIERLVYEALHTTEPERVRVASGDRLVRDMVRAMGAEAVDPAALEAEIAQSLGDTERRVGQLGQEARFSGRLEDRIGPEVRAQLEALRRGQAAPSPPEDTPQPGR